MQTIKSWPKTERPREKLLQQGPNTLSDAELLAIILRNGPPGSSALDLARKLLTQFGGLRQLFAAESATNPAVPGFGQAKFAEIKAVAELTNRHLYEKSKQTSVVKNSQHVRQFLRQKLNHYQQEVFACVFLNAKHAIINFEILFYGSINQTTIYNREIVKRSLYHNAASVILCHNHPSGDPTPSQEDIEITNIIKSALKLVDVQTLDHMIIGYNDIFSLAEHGKLN